MSETTTERVPIFEAHADPPPMAHWVNEEGTATLCGIPLLPGDTLYADGEPVDCVVCEYLCFVS